MDESAEPDVIGRWFAVNLKAARERAGLSQEQLAQRMRDAGHKWHQQTAGSLEAGRRPVRGAGEMLDLARFTGTSIDALVRPPAVTQEAMVLRGATGRLRKLRDDIQGLAIKEAQARERLEALTARLKASDMADVLAEEIRLAERALKQEA